MTDFQGLIETDKLATLSVNGSGSLFWDGAANLYTSVWIWIPLALMAVFLILRNVSTNRLVLVLLLVVATVVCCDQLSSTVFKPLFQRLRPTRDPSILDLVDTVNGYRGGLYGFFSGHAANSFGLAVFFILMVKDLWFGLSVGLWATLNSLIRSYLGVHFVGDIIVGALAGSLIGCIMYLIYKMVTRNDRSTCGMHHDSQIIYTSSGFLRKDIYSFICILLGTYGVILITACVTQAAA